jgi:energy-coupling factor transporter transmembrane protein EcfT
MREAQGARCVELRRNPVKRLSFLVFPFFGRTLRRADEMVWAMEARCYAEERTRVVFQARKRDWGITAACGAVLGCVFV